MPAHIYKAPHYCRQLPVLIPREEEKGVLNPLGDFVFGHEYFEVMESWTKEIVGKLTEDPNGKCRDGSSSNSTTSIQQLKP